MTCRVTHYSDSDATTEEYGSRTAAILSIIDSAQYNHWTAEFDNSDEGAFLEDGAESGIRFRIEEMAQ